MLEAERNNTPATFYGHPWEIDPERQRLDVSPLTRVRHYGGLSRTLSRLARLVSKFEFTTIAETFRAHADPTMVRYSP